MVNLTGAYIGLVEKNDDPERLGRLKVRVPHAYGATGSEIGSISIDNLPWAMPSGLPQGGSALSGAISWIPEPGDQVIVWFLDGEPEKPVWSWMMQTTAQAARYKVNVYSTTGKKPERAALTRYGHVMELNKSQLIHTTMGGYRVVLTDSGQPASYDGKIQLATPKGNSLELDDTSSTFTTFVLQDFNIQAIESISLMGGDFDLLTTTGGDVKITSGSAFKLSSLDNTEVTSLGEFSVTSTRGMSLKSSTTLDLTSVASASITAPVVEIKGGITNIGTAGLQPMLGGTLLMSLLTTLVTWIDTHVHSNGNNGSPTGTPIVPCSAIVTPLIPNLVSKTVFGSM